MKRTELLALLAARIGELRRPHPLRVAVDGVDAAGKTTLADELGEVLRCAGRHVVRASIDDFHHPASVRHARGETADSYFEDSFDRAALVRELLAPLGPNGTRLYRSAVFDHRADAPVRPEVREAPRDAVLLFDGVFLLRAELRPHWDLSIFVQADFATTVARAEIRDRALFGDAAAVRRRYEARYVPGQRLYLEKEQPQVRASLVVVNDDPMDPEIGS